MYSALVLKEDLVTFKKLIEQKNNYGILENTYKDYKINTYIDLLNYNETPSPIQIITDFDIYTSVTRVPTIADDSSIIELGKGDLIIYQDRELEINTCRKVTEDMKEYFVSTLTTHKSNTTYNEIEEELYKYFFLFFEKLGIEAVRHNKFYQNKYYQFKESPYLTYFITEKEKIHTFTHSVVDYIDKTYVARTQRKYNMIIRLYDLGKVIDLDVYLTKNRIFKLFTDEDIFRNIKSIKMLDITYLSNEDTYINDMLLNEKVFSVDFYIDTTLQYKKDAIDKMKLRGEINEPKCNN